MVNFEYQTNVHKKSSRRRHAHKAVFAAFLLGLLIVGVIAVLIWQNTRQPQQASDTITETSVFHGTTNNTYTADHFTFTSPLTWDFSEKESSIPTRYVYYAKANDQVTHEFTVYMDKVPQNLEVTYILPVSSPDGTKFVPGELSPKCSVPKGSNLNPQSQTYRDITFICIPDRLQMIVAAGQAGKGYTIEVTDLNDKTTKVGFMYRDLTSEPSIETFIDLIRSFKLK